MVAAAQFLQHADHPDIGRGVQDRQHLSVVSAGVKLTQVPFEI
jgi:hypothetical protein